MEMKSSRKVYTADFETTVYAGQEDTQVWAAAMVELYTEDVFIANSIDSFFYHIFAINKPMLIYFHNLKFDGSFIIPYLERIGYNNSVNYNGIPQKIFGGSFSYMISDKGRWYYIKIKTPNNKIIEIRDSLNLLPFSVADIGDAFNTKHRKTSIEYTGFRKPGGKITEIEENYIKNDVLVVKEALEYMYDKGLKKMTIGSCALQKYKDSVSRETFEAYFPDLTQIIIDKDIYGSDTADKYIRKSYKGGFCYVSPEHKGKVCGRGLTLDVNSLYPSMMESESGNYYPIGEPIFGIGQPDLKEEYFYFLRLKATFKLKKNHLPTIQIKGNFLYPGNEWLHSSDIIIKGEHYKYYKKDDMIYYNMPELTLSEVDYSLFLDHYQIENIQYLDYCYFRKEIGIFDEFIHSEKLNKINAKTKAERTDAKLMSNNLYGKLASSDLSSYKITYIDNETGIMRFENVEQHNKPTVHIAAGAAVTSYARNFTIRHGQKNYKYFRYSDTDSLHLECRKEDIVDINIHSANYQCWKLEGIWDKAIFARQKTYMEHIIEEDGEKLEKPYDLIKCAGMGKRPKELIAARLSGKPIAKTKEEKKFLSTPMGYSDFKTGLKIPSQLRPKRMKSGVLLQSEIYEMK